MSHAELPLATGGWWACDHPGRPFEIYRTQFFARCRACRLVARAAIVAGFEDNARNASGLGYPTLAEWLEKAERNAGEVHS